MELLFVYGTLKDPKVQAKVIGRTVDAVPATVQGFRIAHLKITDPDVVELSGADVHRVLVPADQCSTVEGWTLELTAQELASADQYEVPEYVRTRHKTTDGQDVWLYVAAEGLELPTD